MMPLFDFQTDKEVIKTQLNKDVIAKISQRRGQILIHSCIYYKMDNNIWTDEEYDRYARELIDLIRKYPEEAKEARFAKEFENWDKENREKDSTYFVSGYDLPIYGEWVARTAGWLLRYHKEVVLNVKNY